jgi:hypothetical protein
MTCKNLILLVLTEINCKKEDVEKYKINGFMKVAKPRELGKGGGILIFYRDMLKVKIFDTKFKQIKRVANKIRSVIKGKSN